MIIFGSILFAIAGVVIISFILLYQKRRYLHRQEIQRIEEAFTKEMLRSQVEMQDQTLRDVASELHDNFNPTLSVINISLASLLPQLPTGNREPLLEIKALIKQMMGEMKSLSTSLNSDHLVRIGFYSALKKYVLQIGRPGMYQTSFTTKGDHYKISPQKEIILFRMCQELLNNIIKHANASVIDVRVEYGNQNLCVEIEDNGSGFDTGKPENPEDGKDSTGLGNLRKRALVLSAVFNIHSAPGKGTRASIELRP